MFKRFRIHVSWYIVSFVCFINTFPVLAWFPECMSNRSGGNYRGKINVTRTGKTCQRWDSQWPHSHDVTAAMLPDGTLAEAKNYCRSPGFDSGGPWCYVTDPEVTWEYCDVPHCGDLGSRCINDIKLCKNVCVSTQCTSTGWVSGLH